MSDAENPPAIPFSLEGKKLDGREGDTLAAALLRAGVTTFTRSIKYHRPRGPFCFAGTCGQCLVRVDGVPSLPACQVPLQAGMSCERQNAPLGLVEKDLFRAVDFLYPGGLDHHHLMIQSRLLGRVALEVARRLAGLGMLPDVARPVQPGSAREVPLVIVGAGPSGLAAARGALETGIAGLRPLLLEGQAQAGGSAKLWLGNAPARGEPARQEQPGDRESAKEWNANDWHANSLCANPIVPAGVELQLGAEVIGLYADEQPSGAALLAVRRGEKLVAVRARRVVLATGGASQPLPFPGNDRPGVYAARGLLELHRRSGVRVGEGKPLALVGTGEEALRCARGLLARGYSLAAMVIIDNHLPAPDSLPPGVELLRGEVLRARGRPVAELRVRLAPAAGAAAGEIEERTLRCGAVAIALPPAPLFDLAASAGARAELSPALGGFPVAVDADGRSSLPWLFACGTAAGQPLSEDGAEMIGISSNSSSAARRAGARAAREACALEAAGHAQLERPLA